MAVIMRDFISFPDLEQYSRGPYDLERVTYSFRAKDTFILNFELGWAFDFFLLSFKISSKVQWELWHTDSAVVWVFEEIMAENPVFECKPYSTPCNIPFNNKIDEQLIQGTATNLKITAQSNPFSFEILLDFGKNQQLSITPHGWKIHG